MKMHNIYIKYHVSFDNNNERIIMNDDNNYGKLNKRKPTIKT